MKSRITALLTAVGLCLCGPGCVSIAAAEEEPAKRAPLYVVVASKCIVAEQQFVLNILFDRKLDKELVYSALGSALTRGGLRRGSCDKAQPQESDDPTQNFIAVEDGLRALTLIVYSGNMDNAEIEEEGSDAGFCSEFDYPRPKITIDDAGRWNVVRFGHGGNLVPKDPPYIECYPSPQRFINCPTPGKTRKHFVTSDYLVQVIHMNCETDPDVRQLVFFGLGNFSEEIRDYDSESDTSIQGAAYLALEFEVHRAIAPLLQ
jgi:hypothetical protein